MSLQKHTIQKRVWSPGWLKWLSLVLLLLLLLCLLLKCCQREQTASPLSTVVPVEDRANWYPDAPGIRMPIDTTMIRRNPDDPLRREEVSNLLNVYLRDTSNIQGFVANVRNAFPMDSIVATFFAEEYKRVQLKMKPDRVPEIREKLKTDFADVKFVVPEWVLRKPFRVLHSDPGFKKPEQSRHLEQIGLFDAWSQHGMGDSSVVIAVIDDSFDLNHLELKGKSIRPWNVFAYTDKVDVQSARMVHGTHVSALVVGNVDNGVGASGVAPNCKIMPIQISDVSGIISSSSILDGIFYALKNKATIINLSLGIALDGLPTDLSIDAQNQLASNASLDEALLWDEVFAISKSEGVIIVQAAGNNGFMAAVDPMKRSNNSIVVGAVSSNLNRANFSNWGGDVSVYAPGEQIFSAIPGNKFLPLDGTSMACPIVSGSIALALSKNKDLTLDRIKELIIQTGEKVKGEQGVFIRIDRLVKVI